MIENCSPGFTSDIDRLPRRPRRPLPCNLVPQSGTWVVSWYHACHDLGVTSVYARPAEMCWCHGSGATVRHQSRRRPQRRFYSTAAAAAAAGCCSVISAAAQNRCGIIKTRLEYCMKHAGRSIHSIRVVPVMQRWTHTYASKGRWDENEANTEASWSTKLKVYGWFGGRKGRGATAALIYRLRGRVLYLSRSPAAHCVFFVSWPSR